MSRCLHRQATAISAATAVRPGRSGRHLAFWGIGRWRLDFAPPHPKSFICLVDAGLWGGLQVAYDLAMPAGVSLPCLPPASQLRNLAALLRARTSGRDDPDAYRQRRKDGVGLPQSPETNKKAPYGATTNRASRPRAAAGRHRNCRRRRQAT